MAEQQFYNAFDDCVDRINRGQNINECLSDYPDQAAVLRPMLEASRRVRQLQPSSLEVGQAQERGRLLFESALQTIPHRRSISYPIFRFASLAAAIFIIFIIASGSITIAAQSSLPGDQLYGLKLFTEQVSLSLSGDPSLSAQFNQHRIDEAHQLLSMNRSANITFQGTITAMKGAVWTIAGLPVQVSFELQSASAAHTGNLVEVQGYTTAQGQLVATSVTILVTATPPTPTEIPTHVPTVIPATPQPRVTATLEPTQTVEPSPTSTETPTLTVTETETDASSPPNLIIQTIAPTACAVTPPKGWVKHIVQSGDTLSHLAASSGISLDLLMAVNCLTNTSLIVVGQTLYLPQAIVPQAATSNSGGDSLTATDDHSGSNSGSGSSGQAGSNSGSSDSGDDHGGDSGGGHSGDG